LNRTNKHKWNVALHTSQRFKLYK